MTRKVHLIRHGDAEERWSWTDPDTIRPLSAFGRAQAMALADFDVGSDVSIYASPAVRCVGTVTPLACRTGTDLVVDQRLAEGSDAREVAEWISSAADAELVLCGHGDVLPEVLRLLSLRGMTLDGPNACQKGSIWTCSFDGSTPTHATYQPPPPVD